MNEKLCNSLTPPVLVCPTNVWPAQGTQGRTPMRPIVSAIGSPSYKLAKELARILTPLTGNTLHTEEAHTASCLGH